MKLIQALGLAFLLQACATQPSPAKISAAGPAPDPGASTLQRCDFDELDGVSFIFKPAEPDFREQAYTAWQLDLQSGASAPAYATHVGRIGKLQPQVETTGSREGFFVAVLDDCSKLYARRREQTETPAELEKRADIYFTDTLAEVEQHLGQTFWLKRWPGSPVSRRLITLDPAVNYTWRTFERVRLVGIERTVLAHAPDNSALLAVVELPSGERALVPWSDAYLTRDDPINPAWSQATLTEIQQGRISPGMPADAVRASWGKPLQINRRPEATIIMEQWVYRDGYAYIRNGYLQSSSGVR